MTFKVRPVERVIERGAGIPPIRLSCRLADTSFAVSMGEHVYVVSTLRAGHDERGPFAIVEEQEQQIGARWTLRVEPEFDEHSPNSAGCQIVVTKAADRQLYERAARQGGHHLSRVHLVVPSEVRVSVHFNPLGVCDGCSFDNGSSSEQPSDN